MAAKYKRESVLERVGESRKEAVPVAPLLLGVSAIRLDEVRVEGDIMCLIKLGAIALQEQGTYTHAGRQVL